jgi:AcrR family transcriptional regulator
MKAARRLFSKNGFSGTSISMLAKAAGIVNQSLIYHHFANKEELWIAVKSEVASKFVQVDIEGCNLRQFVEKVVRNRVDFFNKNPDLLRVIYWQRLERSNKKQMQGLSKEVADNLCAQIRHLQENGEIKKTLDPHLILLMIVAVCEGAHRDGPDEFATVEEKNQDAYLEMAIPGLIATLQP